MVNVNVIDYGNENEWNGLWTEGNERDGLWSKGSEVKYEQWRW